MLVAFVMQGIEDLPVICKNARLGQILWMVTATKLVVIVLEEDSAVTQTEHAPAFLVSLGQDASTKQHCFKSLKSNYF